jgi:hypothetical protein
MIGAAACNSLLEIRILLMESSHQTLRGWYWISQGGSDRDHHSNGQLSTEATGWGQSDHVYSNYPHDAVHIGVEWKVWCSKCHIRHRPLSRTLQQLIRALQNACNPFCCGSNGSSSELSTIYMMRSVATRSHHHQASKMLRRIEWGCTGSHKHATIQQSYIASKVATWLPPLRV